ncbi:telomerase RNA component interacting RNase [Adelges cooleyi]|uniref:telomerase RNA component interacting RNase n=1 Tax=Adelges cooleyi TaxID=133065 RepID=UPI002180659D|nr:telomerase RNA component interacting RNase [Adelges cooleyi]
MAGYSNQQTQNAFKNDGSFLEVFKRFQEQQQQQQSQQPLPSKVEVVETPSSVASPAASSDTTKTEKRTESQKSLPIIGKRKNKVLKTGIVKKVKPDDEKKSPKPTDAWSLYLDEVKRYQETVGEQDNKTRPLVK